MSHDRPILSALMDKLTQRKNIVAILIVQKQNNSKYNKYKTAHIENPDLQFFFYCD